MAGLETSDSDQAQRVTSLEGNVAANTSEIESVTDRTIALESQMNGYTLLVITQDEYDALTTKDPHTIYYVKEE